VGLALRGPRPTPEGLSVQTMLQIPFHGSDLVRRANRRLLVASLRLLMKLRGHRAPHHVVRRAAHGARRRQPR
jgi:hypothetical protein